MKYHIKTLIYLLIHTYYRPAASEPVFVSNSSYTSIPRTEANAVTRARTFRVL